MQTTAEPLAVTAESDASLLARIANLRELVNGHKQRALAMWEASVSGTKKLKEQPCVGKFTEQLVQCE